MVIPVGIQVGHNCTSSGLVASQYITTRALQAWKRGMLLERLLVALLEMGREVACVLSSRGDTDNKNERANITQAVLQRTHMYVNRRANDVVEKYLSL